MLYGKQEVFDAVNMVVVVVVIPVVKFSSFHFHIEAYNTISTNKFSSKVLQRYSLIVTSSLFVLMPHILQWCVNMYVKAYAREMIMVNGCVNSGNSYTKSIYPTDFSFWENHEKTLAVVIDSNFQRMLWCYAINVESSC